MAIKLADAIVYFQGDTKDLDKSLTGSQKTVNTWAKSVSKGAQTALKGALVGGSVAATTAIASLGKAAFDVSRDTKAAAADMASSLGIPTEEAENFANVARDVYRNNFASDVGEAGKAVTEVAKQLKLTANDPSLKKITENAIALNDTFGTEITDSVATVKTLMENFGLTSEQAFDFITAGYQRGLDSSGDFLDSVNEYSTQFSNGGADAGQFFSVLETGMQSGMLGTDKAADAFKEFRLRIADGSKGTEEALAALGLSADDIVGGLNDGTLTVADAFQLVTGRLKATDDQAVRMQAGVGLLGSQFEDLGDSAVAGIDMASVSMVDLAGSADTLNAKYTTFGSLFAATWRKVTVALAPVTDKLLELATGAMPRVDAAINRLVPIVENFALNVLVPLVGKIFDWIEAFAQLSPETQRLIGIVSAITAGVTVFLAALAPLISVIGTVITVFTALGPVIAGVGTILLGLLNPVTLVIAGVAALYLAWQNNLFGIRDITTAWWTNLKAEWAASWATVKEQTATGWANVQTEWALTSANVSTQTTTWWTNLKTEWALTWANLKEQTATGWAGIQTAWSVASAIVSAALTTWWTTTTTAWSNAWTTLQAATTVGWTAIQIAWTVAAAAVSAALSAWWTTITTAWSNGWTAVTTGTITAWSAIQVAWSVATSLLSAAITAWWTAIQAAWVAGSSAITTATTALWTMITTLWTTATAALSTAVSTWWANLSAAWTIGVSTLAMHTTTGWTTIKAGWSAGILAVSTMAILWWTKIKEIWSAAGTALTTATTTAWTTIKAGWSTGILAVSTMAILWWSKMNTIWTNAGTALTTATATAWTTIKAGWSTGIFAVSSMAILWWSKMNTIWANAGAALTTATTTAWSAIKLAWSNALIAMKLAVSLAMTAIKLAFTLAMISLQTTVSTKAAAAVAALKSAFNIDWSSVGHAVVSGIANGISAGAWRISSAARTAANNALASAKAALGIRSPSKVMRDEVGLQISKGVAEGIKIGRPEILAQFGAALSGLDNFALPDFGGAGTTTTNNSPQISIVQNFGNGADAESVRDAANLGILDALRAAGVA